MKKWWLSIIALTALAFTLQSFGTPSANAGCRRSGRRGLVPSSKLSSEKTALKVGKKGEISLADNVQVGSNVLKGGRYLVRCEHKSTEDHEMVFTRLWTPSAHSAAPSSEAGETVRVQCRVQPGGDMVERTSVLITERNGERFVEKIRIQGENVEHLFD